MFGPPVTDIGTISLLTLPGDNDTWSVTIFGSSADPALQAPPRSPSGSTSVVAGLPAPGPLVAGPADHATCSPWPASSTATGASWSTAVPIVTGVAAVGDAWACTNPSAGRGISLGLVHAQQLRPGRRPPRRSASPSPTAWHAGERAGGRPVLLGARSTPIASGSPSIEALRVGSRAARTQPDGPGAGGRHASRRRRVPRRPRDAHVPRHAEAGVRPAWLRRQGARRGRRRRRCRQLPGPTEPALLALAG